MDNTQDILKILAHSLEERKNADPQASYVARLYESGLNKILEKVGEEATEVILAAKDLGTASATQKAAAETALVHEVADLWFHNLVVLAHLNLGPDAVLDVLAKRLGQSGLTEKAARKKNAE